MFRKSLYIDIKIILYYNIFMKRNQSAEDYLECILLLSKESEFVHRVEVARRIGVSQPAVQKAVKILTESGYVECDGLHLHLTAAGKNTPRKFMRGIALFAISLSSTA